MATESTLVAREVVDPPGIGRSVGEPIWLELATGTVFAFLHQPAAAVARSTAVLICPPFGWEEEMSYRARRTWADLLAAAGYPAARLDLPGAGNSAGSPRDPGTVEHWTGAVAGAAQWLRERTGASRIVGLGLGLGGLLAWRATAAGAAIDDLALWAVPGSGRALLREIRIGAGVVAGNRAGVGGDGGLEAAGFLMRAETVAELERMELDAMALPHAASRRVLLLTRGGLARDARISAALEQAGAAVTVADVPGWDALMTDAERSEPPEAAIERTLAWLAERPRAGGSLRHDDAPIRERDDGIFRVGDGLVRERAVRFEHGAAMLFGILCEPVEVASPPPVCGVFLNAGGIRHTGANRNWVEIARRWAARGIPSLRVDFTGAGDSDGDPRDYLVRGAPYGDDRVAQTSAALAELRRRGLPERAVLVGLCTSAYTALHTALDAANGPERPAGLLLLSQDEFFWDPELRDEDLTLKALESLRGRTWEKLRRREVTLADVRAQLRKLKLGRIVGSVRQNADRRSRTDGAFDHLRDAGIETLFVFGPIEPLYDRLERDGQLGRLGRWPNVTVHRMAPAEVTVSAGDHTFRAVSLQHELHACVDAALDRTIARTGI